MRINNNFVEQEIQPPQQPSKYNQLIVVAASILITALLAGFGVYFWQQTQINSLQKNYEDQLQKLKEQTPTQSTNNYFQFKDDALGIEFSYPKSWGTIEGSGLRCSDPPNYSEAAEAGCKYDFTFGDSALAYRMAAGGRSKDYTVSAGGNIVNLAIGFEGKTPQQICQSFNASACDVINSKIVSMTIVPKYEDICPSGPGQPLFSKVVIIDLGEKKVNGLLFEYSFLSKEVHKELYGLFGNNSEKCSMADPDNIDTVMQKAFNNKAIEIWQKIENRTVDQETLTNVDGFNYFVNSIRLK